MSAVYYNVLIVGCMISVFLAFFLFRKKSMRPIVKLLMYSLIICLFIISMFSFLDDNTIVDLGYGFDYREDLLAITNDYADLPDVPPEVLIYRYDDNFIVVKQKPRRYSEFTYAYDDDYTYSRGFDSEYYWLIKKKEKKVFGPLEYKQFMRLCDEFDIPENLRLN